MPATSTQTEYPVTTAWLEFNDLFELFDMKATDLAQWTGLSSSTIYRMRQGNPNGCKTSVSVAEAIVKTLNKRFGDPSRPSEHMLTLEEINWPNGLSYLGRPAFTGGTTIGRVTAFTDRRCGECFTILPLATDECSMC